MLDKKDRKKVESIKNNLNKMEEEYSKNLKKNAIHKARSKN